VKGLREIKKFAGDGENFLALPCCNAVSGQIEKSDIMRCFAQIGQEIQMVGSSIIKPAQIEPWKQRRGVRHIKTPGGSDPGRQSEWQRVVGPPTIVNCVPRLLEHKFGMDPTATSKNDCPERADGTEDVVFAIARLNNSLY
jgi:hypothetical protein